MRRSFIRLLTDDSAGGSTCGFVCAVSVIVGLPETLDNVAPPNNIKVAPPVPVVTLPLPLGNVTVPLKK